MCVMVLKPTGVCKVMDHFKGIQNKTNYGANLANVKTMKSEVCTKPLHLTWPQLLMMQGDVR